MKASHPHWQQFFSCEHRTDYKLGKLAKGIDRRTLKLSAYVDQQAAVESLPAVKALDVRKDAASVPMYSNDKWGICGPAGLAHGVNAWVGAVAHAVAAHAEGETVTPDPTPSVLTQDIVTQFYVDVTTAQGQPFDPSTGANDTGVVLLTMLKVAASTGIGGHKIGAYVECDLHDELYDWASCVFGGLILGYALPIAAQSAKDWTFIPPNLGGEYQPGSWGGHCVFESANDQQGTMSNETWGEELPVGRPFNVAYRDEAWAVLSPDQLNGDTSAISGFALADLKSDLAKIQAQ